MNRKTLPAALAVAVAQLALVASAFAQVVETPSDVATLEVRRRGNMVEKIGVAQDGAVKSYAAAMAPPADDSHKWFITVIAAANCQPCAMLKRDFATSRELAPFVNPSDHNKSWAHYNVYQAEDATQAWRWKNIRVVGYPTILVQPPRNGTFGDPRTVVWQHTGYDGNPKQLAEDLRAAMFDYVQTMRPVNQSRPDWGFKSGPPAKTVFPALPLEKKVTGPATPTTATSTAAASSPAAAPSSATETTPTEASQPPAAIAEPSAPVAGIGQQINDYSPPFTPPNRPDVMPGPVAPGPSPFPGEWPPKQPDANKNPNGLSLGAFFSLLGQMIAVAFGSNTLQNFLLAILASLAGVRTVKAVRGNRAILSSTLETTADQARPAGRSAKS